jgi:hypothetical protein
MFFKKISSSLHAGQNRTMLGSVAAANDLGAIPCAISWLYKGINEKRQKSGARFSVRVSALGINATKPGSSAKDLLAALATGNYLNVRTLSLLALRLIPLMSFVPPPYRVLRSLFRRPPSGEGRKRERSEKSQSRNRIKRMKK